MTRQILFLDDCPTRRGWAVRNLADGGEVVTVATVAECIAALERQPWDVVYLDHDLGESASGDWRAPGTGTEVVRWIITNRPEIGRVIVHSMNTPAGERMAAALAARRYDASYVPYSVLRAQPRSATP